VRPAEAPLPPAKPPKPGENAVITVEYDVPVQWFETATREDSAVEGTAIFPPDEPMGWPAENYERATVYYLDAKDRTVNITTPSGGVATIEYNAQNDVVGTLSPDNNAAALSAKPPNSVFGEGEALDTKYTYNSEGNELESTAGPTHAVQLSNGTKVEARQHVQYGYEEHAPEGGPYGLLTSESVGALDGSGEQEARTTTTSYAGQNDLGWKLRAPTSVTSDSAGLKLTHTTLYEETGAVEETRMPGNPNEKSPHATETIYYTAGANAKAPACGEHPEWASLPCRTQPAKQPETGGLPHLPVTTTTYNMWDEPTTTEETVGTKATRTTTQTYDAAGRLTMSATTATEGSALPAVSYEYNTETGALDVQKTSEGGTSKITSSYNKLGQLASYTDADGNEAKYTYDIDGRLKTVNDGKGTQTYSYDPTSGYLTKLVDSAAGTFKATYDVEGNLLTQSYPNGMQARYTYNQVGEPIEVEYVKTTDCTSECTWYRDSVVPSIHGQWMSQTSTLSTQAYTYDEVGRLTQVQDTPTGMGCTARIYAYDTDTNRTSLTTSEPGPKGECTSTGGAVESHTYDEADRLTDAGTSYNAFGDITALPGTDAGGSELTSSYYADNQLEEVTQHENKSEPEETVGYKLDPAGRTRETIATGKLRNEDTISHYAGPGDTPAWTENSSGTEWTRNITGINGQLVAIQSNSETPVLQLSNLHGDIIATAYLSETAKGLASKADTTEYGVPTINLPPKYAWLGASQLPTELSSGVVAMGARTYVPEIGRFLQPDPVPGGSANAYAYTYGDPLNTSDPSGAYTIGGPSAALINTTAQIAAAGAAEQAAINAAARREAECRAHGYASCEQQEHDEAEDATFISRIDAERAAEFALGGEEEWGEWEYEEEGEYEYASYQHGSENGEEEAHIEPAVLYQSLEPEAYGRRQGALRLCGTGSTGPCARDTSATCSRRGSRQCHGNSTGHGGRRGGPGDLICGGIELVTQGKGCGVENPSYPTGSGMGEGGDIDAGGEGGVPGGHRIP
jgi:RHS repeat-associated protein